MQQKSGIVMRDALGNTIKNCGHSSSMLVGNGSSHATLLAEMRCIKYFARKITGLKNPSGSNNRAIIDSTYRFVGSMSRSNLMQ